MSGKKLAVVTGATGGMGKAIVERLAGDGFEVALLGRDLGRLKATIEQIAGKSAGLYPILIGDLAEPDIAAAIKAIHPEVSALVLAAGGGPVGTLADTDDEMWREAIEGKLLSAVRITRAILPLLRPGKETSIVFIDGIFAYEPDGLFAINSAVNCAIAGFAKALSRDPQLNAAGVRVNVVHPGATDTPLWHRIADDVAVRLGAPDGVVITRSICEGLQEMRLTAPSEIADAVGFLLSPMAVRITGTALTVDGGGLRALT